VAIRVSCQDSKVSPQPYSNDSIAHLPRSKSLLSVRDYVYKQAVDVAPFTLHFNPFFFTPMVQFKSFPLFRLLVLIAECDYVLAGLNVVMHCGRHGFSQRSHCRLRLLSSTTSTVTTTVNFTSVDSSPVIDLSRPNPSVAKLPTPHPTTSATATSAVVKTTSSLYSSPKPTARPLTPNNIKAGIAGGDAYPFLKDHIGWWYDWQVVHLPRHLKMFTKYRSPNPSKAGTPVGVPMLWGGGTADAQDAARLRQFQQISQAPPFVLGFEEPDCASGDGSAGMSVEDGVSKWESLIAPLSKKGTRLGSPSMCSRYLPTARSLQKTYCTYRTSR
jgi:hypothetical protein